MEHTLKIHSLHDVQASCSCGGWSMLRLGSATKEEVEEQYRYHWNYANSELLADAVRLALRNAESELYMLPASDDYKVSAQKDILSAQIGRYRSALGLNQPEPETREQEAERVFGACGGKCGEAPCVLWNAEKTRKANRKRS